MSWNSTIKRKTPMRRAAIKATSKRKAATNAERAYMSAQADAGCVLCAHLGLGTTPCEIHHLRHGMGMGQRNNNKMVIGLCPEHHRGATGYHGLGRREFERVYGVTEMDLWAMAQKQNPVTVSAVPGFSTAQA